MPYDDLGPRTATGVPDPNNPVTPGGWTVAFPPAVIASNEPLIECYHISIAGPLGSSFDVYRGTAKWGTSAQGWRNEWDPQQPLPLRPGDSLYFYWSTTTGPAPTVWLWLRTEAR